jgi:hypothetical protein
MKMASAPFAASDKPVANDSRPWRQLVRTISPRPGSKIGISPRFSASIFGCLYRRKRRHDQNQQSRRNEPNIARSDHRNPHVVSSSASVAACKAPIDPFGRPAGCGRRLIASNFPKLEIGDHLRQCGEFQRLRDRSRPQGIGHQLPASMATIQVPRDGFTLSL